MKNTSLLFTLFLVGCGSSTTVNPDYNEKPIGSAGDAGNYSETGGTDTIGVSGSGNIDSGGGGTDYVGTGGTASGDNPFSIFQVPFTCSVASYEYALDHVEEKKLGDPSPSYYTTCHMAFRDSATLFCGNDSSYPSADDLDSNGIAYFHVTGSSGSLECREYGSPDPVWCCFNWDEFISY